MGSVNVYIFIILIITSAPERSYQVNLKILFGDTENNKNLFQNIVITSNENLFKIKPEYGNFSKGESNESHFGEVRFYFNEKISTFIVRCFKIYELNINFHL